MNSNWTTENSPDFSAAGIAGYVNRASGSGAEHRPIPAEAILMGAEANRPLATASHGRPPYL